MEYVLPWRSVSVLTRVLFWCLFPSLLHNSGGKHQINPLVNAETARHSSTYIILYISFNHTISLKSMYFEMILYRSLLIDLQ